jgi:excisionase family DNA binding protein
VNLEEQIEAAAERGVQRALAPHMHKLTGPERLTYTVRETAEVLGVSEPTVYRLIREGVLVKVPHLGTKVLIPRCAVEWLASGGDPSNPRPPDPRQ